MLTSRRQFLSAGAAALSAGAAAAQTDKPHGVRFGVRTPFPELSLRERALLVHRLGYQGIELGPEWL
ncbi:MAG TPA: twin-arginine translocation signal domain-containing protein, partial [Bryobacteraceae bacterium]|nr:twin-arginine translocation signal domain-containing protein [Bryobacteraceae bacterium]